MGGIHGQMGKTHFPQISMTGIEGLEQLGSNNFDENELYDENDQFSKVHVTSFLKDKNNFNE